MAKGEEITTKFKVDISDLKKGISDANQQIKLANAEFKAATAGLDKWSKSAEGVQAKLKQLDSVLASQKSKLQAYTEQLKRQESAYAENGSRIEQLKAKLADLAANGVSKTSDEYKKYENALASCEKEQDANKKAIDDLKVTILNQQAAVNKTEADINKYGNTLNELEKEEKEAAEAATKQKTAYESLQDTIKEQQNRLNELKSKYSDVVLEQGKNSDAAKELAGEIDKLSSELQENKGKLNEADKAADELDNSLEDTAKSAEEAGDGFTVMKGALANLVAQGIQAAIQGLKDLASASFEAWKSYDEGADTIIAATGATGEAAEQLIGVYENVAKNVVGSFEDIGAAVGEVNTRFGLTGDELQKTSEKFLKFAELNGTDVKSSIDAVQSAMAAFGLGAEDTGNMLDVLNKAGQDTGVSVDQLAQNLVANAPALQEMGMNASDSAFFLANLSKNGVDASSVMAGMKKALANAAAEGKPMSAAMAEIEDSIKNATSSTEAINIATELFGTKAGPAIATAVRDGKLSFEEFGTSLTDFQGNIETTYEAMLDGPDKVALAMQNLKLEAAKVFDEFLQNHGPQLEAMINNFTQNILPAISAAFGAVLEAIGFVIEKGNQFIDWLNSGSLASEAFKVVVVALTAAFTAFMAVLGAQAAWTALIALVGKAKTAFIAFNAILAANPIGIVIAAISALVAAFMYLWNTSEDFRNFWIGLWEAIKNAVGPVIDGIVSLFTNAWNLIKSAWNGALTFFSSIWEGIKKVFSSVANWFGDKFKAAYKAVTDAFNSVVKWFTDKWNGIKSALNEVNTWFKNKFTAAYKAVTDAFNNVVKWFTDKWTGVKNALNEANTWFKNKFTAAYNAVTDAFNNIVKWFTDKWTGIKNALASVNEWFRDKFTAAYKAVTDAFNNVVNWFTEKWNGIKNALNNVNTWFGDKFKTAYNAVTGAWSNVTGWFSDKWSGIKNVFNNVNGWFGDKFGAAWTAIKNKFSSWGSFWGGLWDTIKNKFSSIGTNISNAISGAVRSGVNGVISRIENTINSAINLINGAIGLINLIPGVSVGKIGRVSFPRLAQGGILKKGQVGLLEGSGAEAVVPLDRNKAWIRAVANDMLNELQGNLRLGNNSNISNNKEMNFTQNIYAPKQPSRIELYRQTKNLLAYANVTGGD